MDCLEPAVWTQHLDGVGSACLPQRTCQPNPICADGLLALSIYSPGNIRVFDALTGEERARRSLSKYGSSAAIIVDDLLIVQTDRYLRALAWPSLKRVWTYFPYKHPGEHIYSQAAVFEDSLLVGDRYGYLHCIGLADGKRRWRWLTSRAMNNSVNSRPLVVDDTVYCATNAGIALAYDLRSRRIRWRTHIDGPSGHEMRKHGPDLVVCGQNHLYLMSPGTGEVKRSINLHSKIRSVATSRDRILVLTRGNTASESILHVIHGTVVSSRPSTWGSWNLSYDEDYDVFYSSRGRGLGLLSAAGGDLACFPINASSVPFADKTRLYVVAENGWNDAHLHCFKHPLSAETLQLPS